MVQGVTNQGTRIRPEEIQPPPPPPPPPLPANATSAPYSTDTGTVASTSKPSLDVRKTAAQRHNIESGGAQLAHDLQSQFDQHGPPGLSDEDQNEETTAADQITPGDTQSSAFKEAGGDQSQPVPGAPGTDVQPSAHNGTTVPPGQSVNDTQQPNIVPVSNTDDPVNTAPVGAAASALDAVNGPPPGVPTVADLYAENRGFAQDPKIPFSHVQDGCYARAEVMSQSLEAKGIQTSKIFAFPEGGTLRVPGADWRYHVATQAEAWNPANGKVQPFVLDPAMSGKPMPPSQWISTMNPTGGPVRTVTTPNDAYAPGAKPGEFVKVDDPMVKASGLDPQETINRNSKTMTSQGKLPNGGPPDGVPTEGQVAASKSGTFTRLAGAASRGLGGLAAVGGAVQFGGGVQEWNNGNKVDGAVDMTAGGLNTLGGLALATGVGAPAAPFLFGASAMIDGGNDLVQGIQNGDARQAAVGGAKAAGGTAMMVGGALVATGVGAPVGAALIAGGAVVAGGAALYDAFHEEIDAAVVKTVDTVKDVAKEAKDAVVEKANKAKDAAVETAKKAKDAAVETAKKAKDKAVDTAKKVGSLLNPFD